MPAVLSTKKSVIDPRDMPDIERATMRRIFSFLRPYRRQALLVIGSIVLAALCGALPPLFLKRDRRSGDPAGPARLAVPAVRRHGARRRCSPVCSASRSATWRRSSPSG